MGNEIKCDLVIARVLNNNIVLAKDKGKEKIIFSKGIGFGKKLGSIVEAGTVVDKIFVLENESTIKNFNEVLNRVDSEMFSFFEELLVELTNELGEELNETIHVGLIDHLNFAIKRLKNKEEISNPFIVEIETLYRREFELASKLARKIEKRLGIQVPDGEIGFITLHIHTARKNGKLSDSIKYSYICNSIMEYIEDELDIEIDRQSLDYARFITHMRFALERITNNRIIKNDFIEIIKMQYSESYNIACSVVKIINKYLNVEVNIDETAYIAMHIQRFKVLLDK